MIQRNQRPHRRSERGYNLVEVLIAMAILGTVLLSIVTLFYMGRRNVYSGKQMTHAVAIATKAMEDMSNLTRDEMYQHFLITATDTLASYTIDGETYANAVIRSTDPTIVASPLETIDDENAASTFLTQWAALASEKLDDESSVTLILMPRQPTQVLTTVAPIQAAPTVLQMRVIVRWRDGMRMRNVIFDAVKLKRRPT